MGEGGGPEDRLKRLVAELAGQERQTRRAKHNRTLSLDQEHYLRLQAYCHEKGLKVANIVDRLMADFLQALEEEGEIPPKSGP
jgi:hypothetical protein